MGSAPPTLRVAKLRANAQVPAYATPGAAGMDLTAALDASIALLPGAVVRVPTGIAIGLPENHEGQVRPRSGLAARHGITVLNSPGTIDEDYRGEVQVLLINHGQATFTIEPGDRIAQLVIAPIVKPSIEAVDGPADLGDTSRGSGGFGSTGR